MNGAHLTLTLAAALAAASFTRRGSLARTAIPGLPELRAAMVQAASEDTAYGQGYRDRRDPLALHCGPVSYVVQRKYGGDILSGKAGNEPHLWNRLPDGTEVDLSGSQYGGDGWGPVTKGRVVPGRRSVNPRFARFASRVEQALSRQGSRAHYEDEGIVDGHWGRAGSGVLVTDGARVLLLLRSGEVHTPYVWGYAGGAIPVNRKTGKPMDAKASALHEADEEMGGMPPGRVVRSLVKREPDGFTYTTFVWRVTPSALDDFEPELNWEHDDWRVFRLTDLPSEIHPGALWAIRQMVRP